MGNLLSIYTTQYYKTIFTRSNFRIVIKNAIFIKKLENFGTFWYQNFTFEDDFCSKMTLNFKVNFKVRFINLSHA